MPGMHIQEPQYHNVFPHCPFSQFLVGHPGLQLRLRAPAEGGSGSAGHQTRLPQCGGRGGTCRLSVFLGSGGAMKTWGWWWMFISGFPMENLEKCGIPICHVNMIQSGVLICFNEVIIWISRDQITWMMGGFSDTTQYWSRILGLKFWWAKWIQMGLVLYRHQLERGETKTWLNGAGGSPSTLMGS